MCGPPSASRRRARIFRSCRSYSSGSPARLCRRRAPLANLTEPTPARSPPAARLPSRTRIRSSCGASGAVGGHVAGELLSRGVPFKALARDRANATKLTQLGMDVVVGDYDDPDGLVAAFTGIGRLFLVSPLLPGLDEKEGNAIDAAVRAGVHHVVKLSTAGVGQTAVGNRLPRQYPLHRHSEQHVEASGMAFTHLRPGPFMQNTLNFAPSVVAEGVFRGAWGDGRMGYVDVRDVGAVAARVLSEEGHEGRAYELTGPESLSPSDIARSLSAVTGRDVRYVDVPAEGLRQAMLARGMAEWFAGAVIEVMEHTRSGAAAHVTNTMAEIKGQPVRSYGEFAREYASRFLPSAGA